jgi:exonuclease III
MVTSVALYGLMDEFSDASVHRSLSELSPVLDDPRYREMVIVGGDLNTGTQWPKREQSFNARDRNVLDRFTALGLVDCIRAKRAPGRLNGCLCLEGNDCAHVRTRKDPKHPDVPYQTDYLFASPKLASALVSCEVLASDEWFAISDHAPIVADFQQ